MFGKKLICSLILVALSTAVLAGCDGGMWGTWAGSGYPNATSIAMGNLFDGTLTPWKLGN